MSKYKILVLDEGWFVASLANTRKNIPILYTKEEIDEFFSDPDCYAEAPSRVRYYCMRDRASFEFIEVPDEDV